jgi:hypothetical protein
MPTVTELQKLLQYATPAELAEIDELLLSDPTPWHPLPGPQTQAFESEADITGYGGAAGGGKTDLLAGLVLTKHKRALIVRREKAQTEGVVQRLEEIIGHKDGYNSQKGFWRLPTDAIVEFAGLDNPGDERRWQGRPHDLKAFDEATEMREEQVRFIMGWTRSNDPSVRPRAIMTFNPPTTVEGRWVIKFFGPWLDKKHHNPAKPGELRWFTTVGDDQDYEVEDGSEFVLEGNKTDGFKLIYDFDREAYTPEQIIQPKSRTFIPARLTDNPYYMATGYMSTLQALPEPLRSQMLRGDFLAGMKDGAMQVIPTAWVEIAQARWKLPDVIPPMDSMGVDVARGGDDSTVTSARHGMWFAEQKLIQGEATNSGPKVAGLVVQELRDDAPIHIDVIGVGASPYDHLNGMGFQIMGVNVAEASLAKDMSGRLGFFNLRSQLWWQMREALDPDANNGIALPPDPKLLAELTAPLWTLQGAKIKVESREDIVKRTKRSPDRASALILANMDTPKRAAVARLKAQNTREYDPMAMDRGHRAPVRDYDPLNSYR